MAAMKIQDGALETSQLRYGGHNRFISRRSISGASFMFISSTVFKKWKGRGGAFDPSQGRPKKPSLNRVKTPQIAVNLDYTILEQVCTVWKHDGNRTI